MGEWGTGSFENDAASDWFYVLEEAVDPGLVIVSALDDVLAEAGHVELDAACAAVAAAELSASCAGEVADDLPDHIRRWVGEHPHEVITTLEDPTLRGIGSADVGLVHLGVGLYGGWNDR